VIVPVTYPSISIEKETVTVYITVPVAVTKTVTQVLAASGGSSPFFDVV
jgi:hypothetical protein